MFKKRGKKEVKAIFIIANLIIAVFAFSWIVGAQEFYKINSQRSLK